jgi:hypothetical protein
VTPCSTEPIRPYKSFESVSFDSTEVMIGVEAANGRIKIWDIEEAKGVN